MKNSYLKLSFFLFFAFLSNIGFSQTYVVENDSATTTTNTPVIIDVRANDTYVGNCTYTVVFSAGSIFDPQNGTITIVNNDSIEYTPNTGFTGNDEFVYGVATSSIGGACDSARVFITVVNPTGVTDQSQIKNGFTVFPNPAVKGMVYINDMQTGGADFEIRVFDLLGKSVFEQKQINNVGTVAIDVSDVNSGCYLIEVNTEKERFIQKLIIE